jgi:hypothetical protein
MPTPTTAEEVLRLLNAPGYDAITLRQLPNAAGSASMFIVRENLAKPDYRYSARYGPNEIVIPESLYTALQELGAKGPGGA